MPDTLENQHVFPQPSGQKKGCGFPVVAFVGVFCLATGAALAISVGKWFQHDLALFHLLRHVFDFGDIMLADRGFCSYAEMGLFSNRGVDVVMRLHQARKPDFRRGRVVGVLDHIVTWKKPIQRPSRLRKKDFKSLPSSMEVREVRYDVVAKGFRPQSITLATTLLDPEKYPAEDLAALYFRRWEIEVDFYHIKIAMGMDVLRGRTPDVIRKEIWMHLIAYNLTRSVMWETSKTRAVSPLRISFKGAIQQMAARSDLYSVYGNVRKLSAYDSLLDSIAGQIVPHRPFRFEPRSRKRRPKNYRLMTRPRAELKAAIGA